MRVYLCVDDTDDITKRTSTGAVAEQIGKALVQKGAVLEEGITRHQLLLHPDIRYTSHNSAMCLVMQVEENGLSRAQVTAVAREIVQREQAESADPGLALCWGEPEQGRERLIAFGTAAKERVMTKEQAAVLAKQLPEVQLFALGRNGNGTIGALAGLGLRMGRNDGTFRGKKGVHLRSKVLTAGQMKRALGIEQIVDETGTPIPEDAEVTVGQFVKLSLQKGMRSAVAVQQSNGCYILSSAREDAPAAPSSVSAGCPSFRPDQDEEEQLGLTRSGCGCCRYRRWVPEGYQCVRGQETAHEGR